MHLRILSVALFLLAGSLFAEPVNGWLHWRGPLQTGVSLERDVPKSFALDDESLLFSMDLAGRGTPVIAGDRLYVWGYRGEGSDLQEVLMCLDATTGKKHWEHTFNDFLSDIIYNRYSIGSPAVDPQTGNIYIMSTAGVMTGFTPDGKQLWEESMMEKYGRLTFPNGRTGSPAIVGDLVITRGITANWGSNGPARDRFYAFDKHTGALVWSSTPGVRPTDSSFSPPVFVEVDGRLVFYAGTGCGNIVCVDARTGQALSRFQFLTGGVNSAVLPYKDNTLIVIHGKENLDTSEIGRTIRLKADKFPAPGEDQVVLPPEAEMWRNVTGIFTSSGVIVGDRVYQVNHTGTLVAMDADSGKILWEQKLSYTQLHASPTYADGHLYVPMKDGTFYVIRPTDEKAEIVHKVQLEGECLGAPAIWNGKIYVHTTKKLYAFGSKQDNPGRPEAWPVAKAPKPGKAHALQVLPEEFALTPGDKLEMKVRSIDSNGVVVDEQIQGSEWESFIPPTAKVKVRLNGKVEGDTFVADAKNTYSAGMFKASKADKQGFVRGRILNGLPFSEDFDGYDLKSQNAEGTAFAFPPLPWIGARFKWEIQQVDGSNALAKTLDNLLFQRAITFIGPPESKGYTVAADVMSDGNRRIMSTVGVINQRYIVVLDGNWQKLEVFSNHDRLKVSVPFSWKAGTWYRIETRVDIAADGSGMVRAKAWERGTEKPAEWTIEVPHQNAHPYGAPGLYGFAPQGKKRVYIDNVSVTPSK